MLSLRQGLFAKDSPATTAWTPLDMLNDADGEDYWWHSGNGVYQDDGVSSVPFHVDGGEDASIGIWEPYKNIGNASTRVFSDASAAGKDFLHDQGYVYSQDGENSKFTLLDGVGGSAVQFEMSNFYICMRVRFSTFTGGSDCFYQDLDNPTRDVCKLINPTTIRMKINSGTNRNFDIEEIQLDTWVTIEFQRHLNAISVFVNGSASVSNTVIDSGTSDLDRIFAVSDGHVADFLIKSNSIPSDDEKTKLRNYLNNFGNASYGSASTFDKIDG